MPQFTFSSEENFIELIDSMAEKESRSRSEMIDILLRFGYKEKTRPRSGKKSNIKNNAPNSCESNPGR